MSALTWIVGNLGTIFGVILATKIVAEAIVNLTPTPKDDEAVAGFYKAIEVVAGIWGTTAKEFPGSREMKQKVSEAATASFGASKPVDMSDVDAWLNGK